MEMKERVKVYERRSKMKKEWLQEIKRFCEEESGVGVVEIILVLVGIFTPYYGVGIRCMA